MPRNLKPFMLATLASIVAVANLPAADQAEAKLPQKEQFHIYLLMGQSNMAGRGVMTDADRKAHPRVLKLDSQNRWVAGADPLHSDKPTIAGVGPGSGFGRAMADADESVIIGLVPCAVGGTPLSRWVKGGDLYNNAVKRARVAMDNGTLKGVIWHQGESDSYKQETAETYGTRLAQMIADLRADLKTPDLPFVAGKLGDWIKPDRLPYKEKVDADLAALPDKVPATACVDSKGLKPKDAVHFDADSAREFGRRYARAMLGLQKAAKKEESKP
jgi:hypothetical protein